VPAVAFIGEQRKRRLVVAAVVASCFGLFVVQWTQAPRVEASRAVTRQLASVRGELYLGKTFEGLPLRTVRPFFYSDCEPGKPKTAPMPCRWLKVDGHRVTGGDAKQVARARAKLRPVEHT
jgi:hypothetical protein